MTVTLLPVTARCEHLSVSGGDAVCATCGPLARELPIWVADGLDRIIAILGPDVPKCPGLDEGCRFEWGEALQIARNLRAGLNGEDHWEIVDDHTA